VSTSSGIPLPVGAVAVVFDDVMMDEMRIL